MIRLRAENPNQDREELASFVRMARNLDVRRYLEIGSRYGDSFYAVMANLNSGAFGMSIDLPGNAGCERRLRDTMTEIEVLGSCTELVLGSSRDQTSILAAHHRAPFDLILIDADHRYDGVKADWQSYAHLAPVVALHDVAAPKGHDSDGFANDVGQFWSELKSFGGFREIREFITPGSNMGFGIIFR